jgi:hypothetical protein
MLLGKETVAVDDQDEGRGKGLSDRAALDDQPLAIP